MKKMCFLTALFLWGLIFFNVPVKSMAADGFTITSYHVDMKVTKQNTYQIKETIQADFYESRHGIYRDIPLINEIVRSDGSRGTTHAKISNITCPDAFNVSASGDFLRLKIGDKNRYISGPKEYVIGYDYEMGEDILEGGDEFYYNIIGKNWTTSISDVSFTIEMPGPFERENLGMSHGKFGGENSNDFSFKIEGNKIDAKLNKNVVLEPGEAVTVRLLLQEGYFQPDHSMPLHMWLTIGIGSFSMVLAFILWMIYGRDDPVIETIEFYPPIEGNSLEMAFLYNGEVSGKDVISLIVYLAQKGYLDIVEGTGKNDFVLVRRKYYDGDNRYERLFMEGLFQSADIVNKSMLQNKFYKTVQLICGEINEKENKTRVFHASSLNKSWILWLLSIAIYVCTVFPTIYEYTMSLTDALFCSASGLILMVGIFVLVQPLKEGLFARIFSALIFFVLKVGIYFVKIYPIFVLAGKMYLGEYIFAVISIIVTMFFNAFMSKRTEYGTRMLGRIRGFKNFLEVAEKDRLEMLVGENPQYFYEILPFTYVLDVSDVWMKKFESIAIEPPAWYGGNHYSTFNVVAFHHFMSHAMVSAGSSMTSSPHSGGGGISGGGSGGGGGGSW